MSAARILVFAKAPLPGRVKTRLCPPLQPRQAALLHTRMVWHTLETACTAAPGAVELHCAPAPGDYFFTECARRYGVSLHRQAEGDIGARMAHALRAACRDRPLLLIGTDCPARSTNDLRAAIGALDAGEHVVLGPVEDGGYSLIGLSRCAPQLFADIAWSTDRVSSQTLARIRASGLRSTLLPVLWDVDQPAELARLRSTFPELLAGLALDVALLD